MDLLSKTRKITLLLNGNLPAQTLNIVIDTMRSRKDFAIDVLSSGEIFDEEISRRHEMHHLTDETIAAQANADLLILAPRTPGKFEGNVCARVKKLGTKVLAICSDIGGGIEKYRNFSILPDKLAVPDSIVKEEFIASGIPSQKLVEYGSPYLDAWVESCGRIHQSNQNVCLYEVPNQFDWRVRHEKVHYCEQKIASDLASVCLEQGAELYYRHHPWNLANKRFVTLEPNFEVATGDLKSLFSKCNIVVSTYSTVLVLARISGLKAISYQPSGAPVRKRCAGHTGLT